MNAFPDRHLYTARLFAVLLAFLCGVRSASAEPIDPGGGIGGTGITGFGVVQKFGSIFVNGREYFLDSNTRVTRDGISIDEKTLHLGDVVRVQSRIDAASGRSIAVHIDSELALQGAVEKVDAASDTLIVLGQTVHVISDTLGDGAKTASQLAQIRPSEHIAVSGFAQSHGSWIATRIAPVAAGESRFVLRGEVQKIDREHERLRVAGQELIASSGMLPAQLKVGNVVRVAGRYDKSVLHLESVVAARPMLGRTGGIVEMSGYVQTPHGAGRLVSNDVALTYSDASIFIGGTAADLRADVPVAVRGELQADGSVLVRAILINVEPMHVTLPEPDVQAPREGIGEGRASHGVAEKSDREKPETGQPGAETREIDRPNKPEVEKPEIEKPEIAKPEVERPMIDRPEIETPNKD